MDFFDTLTLDAPKITQDGYMAASVRAARVGIQDYLGSEVGKPEMSVVRVYRPESEVFNRDTLNSFTSIPVTNDHPPEAVTADNWKKYATGNTGEDWARDGEFMRVSVLVKDAETIKAVQSGKKQLSCGYQCDLKWEAGITTDGQSYDAIQTNIRGNHLAIVTAARGGPKLKIGDSQMTIKTIIIDGHSVEASDAAQIAVMNLQNKLNDARSIADTVPGLQAQIAALTTSVSAKDGQIAALTQQVADAAITPAMMDAAITARSVVVDAAKKIIPTLDATGKTENEIKRTVVLAKLGDAAKSMDDAAISGAFLAFSSGSASDPIRDHFQAAPAPIVATDFASLEKQMQDSHAKMVAGLKTSGAAN